MNNDTLIYKNISYSEDFLELLNNLSPVSQKLKIRRTTDEDGNEILRVVSKNSVSTFLYLLTTAPDKFGIDKDVGIISYPKFNRLFEASKEDKKKTDAEVNISLGYASEDEKSAEIIKFSNSLWDEKDSIRLSLGDPDLETFDDSWGDVFPDETRIFEESSVVTKINLSEDFITTIQRRNSLIGGEFIKIEGDTDTSSIIFTNYKMHSGDSCSTIVKVDESEKINEESALIVDSSTFNLLPRLNYTCYITDQDLILLTTEVNGINLRIVILTNT